MKNTVVEFIPHTYANPGRGSQYREGTCPIQQGIYFNPEMHSEIRAWALHWECSFSEACRRILSVGLVNLARKSKRTRRARKD